MPPPAGWTGCSPSRTQQKPLGATRNPAPPRRGQGGPVEISGAFRGIDQAQKELARIDRDGRAATVGAVRAVQNLAKSRVRSRLRGKPRWSHRGASSRTGPEVNLDGPKNSPRSGGPGRFTGQLASGVSGMKRPRTGVEGVRGAVWMGKGGVRNLYKWRLEKDHPYFAPAVKAMEPQVAPIWEKAWKKVIDRRQG